MAQVYDPEELKKAEEKPSGSSGSLSTSTTGGKVKYNTGEPKAAAPGGLSSSTGGGQTSYDTSPEIPEAEQSLYRSSATKPGKVRFGNFFGRKRNRFIAGGVAAGAVAGASLVIFFSLLPLKILHTVKDLESHFFAGTNTAMTREVDNMMGGYLKKFVLPGLKRCGGGGAFKSTIDKSCSPVSITGTSPVANLYRAWKNARFENVLADKGTEFRYNTKSGRYYIKSPYLSKDVDISDFADGHVADFMDSAGWKEVSGSEFAQFGSNLHKEVEDLTRFQQVMYRFKMTGILHKYGSTRCVIACDTRKALKDKLSNKKRAAQIKIAQRVLDPQSEQLSLIIQCVIAGCDVTPGSGAPGLNGEPRSQAEVELQQKLADLAAKEGTEATLDAVSDAVKSINEKGWTKYAMGELLAQIVGRFGGDEAAQQSARELSDSALGPVGWAVLASQIIDGLNKAGPIVRELGYQMDSSAYAKTYLTFRTYADEINDPKAPKDATMVGSFTQMLGPGSQDAFNTGEPELGGTAEAEQTPLYQTLVAHDPKVGSSTYLCQNDKPIPSGQLVCPEEKIGKGNKYLDSLHNFLNLPGLNILTELAGVINGTIGSIIQSVVGPFTGVLSFIAEHTPGVSDAWNKLQSLAKGILTPLLSSLVNKLIYVPTSSNMSGGRTFDAMAGGGDVVANDFSHHELGGVVLTDQQVAANLNYQTTQEREQFQNQSFVARMFDSNSDYSVTSKLAMAMPWNTSSAKSSIAAIFVNPFKNIGALFSFNHAQAAGIQSDPFGITQYGYPADDPVFNTDADTYWDQHCTDSHLTDAWNKDSLNNINEDTLQPENPQRAVPGLADGDPKGTNPCLLIQAAVGSAGAIYDSSLLTPDDTAGTGSSDTAPINPPPAGPVEEGTNSQLAQKILNYQKTGEYHCDNGGDCTDLQKIVSGQSLTPSDGCQAQTLDPRVLKLILYVIENGGFKVGTYALCGDHHFDSATGHSGGFAVDFATINGVAVNSTSAKPTTLKFVQFVNSLKGELAPRQLISGGYGDQSGDCSGGVYDVTLQSLEIPNSATFGGNGGDNACHRNHVHVGY